MKRGLILFVIWATSFLLIPYLHAANKIQLPSRVVEPSKGTTEEFINVLKAVPSPIQHGLATFSRRLTDYELRSLAAAGIHVLSPYRGTTYRVRVEKSVRLDAREIAGLDPKLIPLMPQDRVRTELWLRNFNRYQITVPGNAPRNYVLNSNGTINLTVRFHRGVPSDMINRVLAKHAISFDKQSDVTWVITIELSKLGLLAAEDVVQWLDAGPPPFIPENNNTRPAIGVALVQQAPSNLTGNGVQVGVFDMGIDQGHDDLTGRILLPDAIRANHGTHVAGVVAGNGSLSAGVPCISGNPSSCGSALKWRGMAPQAKIIEAVVTERISGSSLFTGAEARIHLNFINGNIDNPDLRDLRMGISNHSYAVSFDGIYDTQNQLRDELIRGIALVDGTQVPGRLQVYSAGNQGQFLEGSRTPGQVGFYSLTKEVKNGLIVGNWNVVSGQFVPANQMNRTSSLGPAYDGRIKPDVVAPGTYITSTCYSTSGSSECNRLPPGETHGYLVTDGTSQAAPAVTGMLALVLEKYASTYGATPPLPSSLRAVTIHTANDIASGQWFCNPDGSSASACPVVGDTGHALVKATPGPDFATGWGLVNAQAAVQVVANHLLYEDGISVSCEIKNYRFVVPAGTTSPIRITLAWDDLPADPTTGDADPRTSQLINDLDLMVVDPRGTNHYPWRLNQIVEDTNDNSIADAQQQCNTEYTVRGQIQPQPATMLSNPDGIPLNGFPAAERGKDHLNNVEVVDVNPPAGGQSPGVQPAGTWIVRVTGFNVTTDYDYDVTHRDVDVGSQRFSLVGPFTLSLAPDPTPPAPPTGLRVN